jgi:hydrogenase expression/formation protein HypC
MCLGIPMKVIKVKGDQGVVELDGVSREVSFQLLEGVKEGEYVIIHAGFAIQKLDEKEALETLSLFQSLEEKQ